MKTVLDVVNESKGFVENIETSSRLEKIIFESIVNNSIQSKGDLCTDDENHNPKEWCKVCSVEEFNQCVEDCSNNKGWENIINKIDWSLAPEGATDHLKETRDEVACWIKKKCDNKMFYITVLTHEKRRVERDNWIPTEDFSANKLTPRPEPVYTKQMQKDDINPVIGSEVILNIAKGAHEITEDQYKHNGEIMTVVAIVHSSITVLVNLDNLFTFACNNAHFKPLTPPIELIDGKAYQFDHHAGNAAQGTYDCNGKCFWVKGSPALLKCASNIKLLEVK